MIDKNINFHDVINVTNCKSIEDETIMLGEGKSKVPCRIITICQNYDGHSIRTVVNLFGQNGQDTVPMEI